MLAVPDPVTACSPLLNGASLAARVVLVQRGGCMFIEKVSTLALCDCHLEDATKPHLYGPISALCRFLPFLSCQWNGVSLG